MREDVTGVGSLRDTCSEFGLILDKLDATLLERFRVLAATTETVRDVQRIVHHACAVFGFYEQHKPAQRFTENEKRIVVIGSLFADIGKAGPLHANAHDQRLIAEMFSVEGVLDDQQSVAEFLRRTFPTDASARRERFAALGLDPQMTLRTFWNLHAGWTLEIIRHAGVPEEAVAAAATHHMLENVNPETIVGLDGRYSVDFGDNAAFDRAEKLVILLDKYDAMRRRTSSDHREAITWLRKRLSQHPKFHDDQEFLTLLEDMDRVGDVRAT